MPVSQLPDQVADLADLDRIEPGGRLVEDQDVGIVNHRLGQAHALAKPARKVAEDPVLDLGQAAPRDHLADRQPPLRASHVLELGPVAKILGDAHLVVERHVFRQVSHIPPDFHGFVEDIVPGEHGDAAGRRQVGCEDPHRGRLAGPVGAQADRRSRPVRSRS